MASGKRYTITTIAQIKAALLDKYGAYDAGTNPNGVTVHYESTTSIIFSCTAISDKVIRFFNLSYGYCAYGDAWVSGDAVTNQVIFGGDTFYSNPTDRELILANNAFVANWYSASDAAVTDDRIIVIAKMSNGKYVCIGAYQHLTYGTNTKAFITDGNIEGYPVTGVNSLLSASGELFKSKIYFGSLLNQAQVNTDGSLAYLLDVETVYYKSMHLAATSTYVLTSSRCAMSNIIYNGLINSLIIELA